MSGVVIGESLRRHFTSIFVVPYLLILAMVGLASSRSATPAAAWPSMSILLAIILGSRLIGPEFSSGTLQLILVKPIKRSAYVLSRVAGVVLVVTIAIALAALCEAIGRLLWENGVGLQTIGHAVLASILRVALVAALLALLGSLTRAYFSVALYFAIMLGIETLIGILNIVRGSSGGFFGTIGEIVARYPGIAQALTWLSQNLFPDAPRLLNSGWVLMVASNSALALLLACLRFRTREVPYGAD
ncbi:MAG TPA: ABC transporter permease subunit [Thermoanaerobaculia bacterium]|jgi:ABC-type transport system involved in multi-copper enzyme maturation permease subunit